MRWPGRAARVGTRRRGRGAEHDRDRAQRGQGAHRPHGQAIGRPRPGAGLKAAAPGERDGGDEDDHRQAEMGHDEARRQVLTHGEAAKHGLGHDAQGETQRQPGQVAAKRLARERQHGGEDGQNADQARDGAVAELDQGMGGERRQRLAVALGPVRAAQAGVGQPHRRTGQHDQCQGDQRGVGELAELVLVDGEPLAHAGLNAKPRAPLAGSPAAPVPRAGPSRRW